DDPNSQDGYNESRYGLKETAMDKTWRRPLLSRNIVFLISSEQTISPTEGNNEGKPANTYYFALEIIMAKKTKKKRLELVTRVICGDTKYKKSQSAKRIK
ncbi:hypothetical protein LCGC14_1036740, partial [marine sediment metagenome]